MVIAAIGVFAGPALAARSAGSNWAGYVASRPGVRFTQVSATWVQPAVSCKTGKPAYMSSWVGLGGDKTAVIEQIGTEADCSADGRATYSSWFELVPSVSGDTHLKIRPGDVISASVMVAGHDVRLRIINDTSTEVFTRRLHASVIDQGSADWIVEAPAVCATAPNENCRDTALADFGAIVFSKTRAAAARHSGAIADARWSASATRIATATPPRAGARGAANSEWSSAIPGRLNATGEGFPVTFI